MPCIEEGDWPDHTCGPANVCAPTASACQTGCVGFIEGRANAAFLTVDAPRQFC